MSKWIDINEKQPEVFQTVLFFCQGGNMLTGKYYNWLQREGRQHYGKYGRYCEPAERGYVCTHWMELPKAPVSA